MKMLKVKLLKSYEELPEGIYDAIELANADAFKVFANTGWYLVASCDIEIVKEVN